MKIQDLINVQTLHEAGFDKVREVHSGESEDYFGNPIYVIWVLLDSALKDEDFRLQKLAPLRDWAYARAWEFGGETIVPSVRIRRQSEWPVEATA